MFKKETIVDQLKQNMHRIANFKILNIIFQITCAAPSPGTPWPMMVTLVFVLLGAGGGAWWMMLAMAVCEDDDGSVVLVSGIKEFMPW